MRSLRVEGDPYFSLRAAARILEMTPRRLSDIENNRAEWHMDDVLWAAVKYQRARREINALGDET